VVNVFCPPILKTTISRFSETTYARVKLDIGLGKKPMALRRVKRLENHHIMFSVDSAD